MAARIVMHHREFLQALKPHSADNLARAGEFHRRAARQTVNRPNLDGRRPSRPGEPPRRRTGAGRDAIVSEVDRDRPAARVGVTRAGLHLAMLEQGTSGTRPRPWLVAALLANRAAIGRLAASRIDPRRRAGGGR